MEEKEDLFIIDGLKLLSIFSRDISPEISTFLGTLFTGRELFDLAVLVFFNIFVVNV